MKKKIAIVSTGLLPQPAVKGGAVESLVDALIDYNERNDVCDLHIISLFDKEAMRLSSKSKSTKYVYINNSIFNALAKRRLVPMRYALRNYGRKVASELKARGAFDEVVIENEFTLVPYIAKVVKNNLILHLHNDYTDDLREADFSFSRIKKVLCVSKFVEGKLKQFEPSVQSAVVYNGIDTSLFEMNEDIRLALRNINGISQECTVIVFVGRVSKEKGVKELISAFKSYSSTHSSKLLLIGPCMFGTTHKTKYCREVEDMVSKLSNVSLIGEIQRERLVEYINVADIACVPSVEEEAFGLTIVEFMAAGLPLVVSNSGAISELVSLEFSEVAELGDEFINNLSKALAKMDHRLSHERNSMKQNSQYVASGFNLDVFAESFYKSINVI